MIQAESESTLSCTIKGLERVVSIAWYDSENKPVNKELFTVGDLEREPSGSATTHQASKLALNSDMTTKDSSFFCNFTINRALTEGLSTAVDVFSKFENKI